MATPDIKGTGADPTHHIVLYDGTTELGFVVTDQGGDLDERTFRRFPFADPTDPYITEKQASFGGGFGQHKFEDDRSKYWKSEGVDTTKDKIVLGSQFHYAEGLFDECITFVDHSDQEFGWTQLIGATAYISMKFTTPAVFTNSDWVKFWLRKVGNGGGYNLVVRIHADSGGDPGSILSTNTIVAGNANQFGEWVRASLPYGLDAATTYHISWHMSTEGTATECYEIGGNGTQANGQKSADGSDWSTAANDFFYRVESNGPVVGTAIAVHDMFEYKGAMYFVKKLASAAADSLWRNGWRGAADVQAGGTGNLEDATNSDWAARITGDEVVEIVAGPTSGEQEDYRHVNKSDLGDLANGVLPIIPNWRVKNRTSDDYIVKNTNWFYEIGLTGTLGMKKISDIAVSKGQMFLCRTNREQVLVHREYNEVGTWLDDSGATWREVPQNADFAQVVRDPKDGDFIWFGVNANSANDLRPEVCRSVVTDYDDDTMNFVNIASIEASRWVAGDVNVAIKSGGDSIVKFEVLINKVNTLGIDVPGATYTNGQFQVTLVDSGSSGTAKCTVTVTAGSIASIDSIDDRGYDYSTGSKQVTGLSGGDGNARIEVTGLDGFNSTGLLAYYDLVDGNGDARTVDIRYVDEVSVDVMVANWQESVVQSLSAGELTIAFDDSTGSLSPLETIGFPQLRHRQFLSNKLDTNASMPTTVGADAITSVGFSLTGAKTKSFTVFVFMAISGFNDTDIVTVGHKDGDDITGMNTYGDPEALWVFTESGMGEVSNNRYKPVPLRELSVASHPNNGRANEVHDVYLMFSWRGRLQRYFRQNLEDLGPDFPTGLNDIAGDIVDVVTYPGRMYAAVDGGLNGRSMVLCFKGGAWHEVFTSFSGERIRKLFIQAIPGKSDRLWVSIDTSVMWFPIALDAVELQGNTDYTYRPMGFLDTSWIYTENMDLNKLWRSIVMVRNAAGDTDLTTNVFYQIDDPDAAWTQITDVDALSASAKEYNFSDGTAGAQIQGNRVRIRIELQTVDLTKSPVVRSIQMRSYRLPEIRFAWTWIAKASSISINLRGDEERALGTQTTITAALAKMDSWGAEMTQLTVETNIKAFNGRTVLVEPLPYQLLTMVSDENIEEDVIQVSVNDI